MLRSSDYHYGLSWSMKSTEHYRLTARHQDWGLKILQSLVSRLDGGEALPQRVQRLCALVAVERRAKGLDLIGMSYAWCTLPTNYTGQKQETLRLTASKSTRQQPRQTGNHKQRIRAPSLRSESEMYKPKSEVCIIRMRAIFPPETTWVPNPSQTLAPDNGTIRFKRQLQRH